MSGIITKNIQAALRPINSAAIFTNTKTPSNIGRKIEIYHGTSSLSLSTLKEGDTLVVNKIKGLWGMVKPCESLPLAPKIGQFVKGQVLTRGYAIGSLSSNTETPTDNKTGKSVVITFEISQLGTDNEENLSEQSLIESAIGKSSPIVHLPGGTTLKVKSVHHINVIEGLASSIVINPYTGFVAAPIAALKTAMTTAEMALEILAPVVEIISTLI